jgi:hypothetical protein
VSPRAYSLGKKNRALFLMGKWRHKQTKDARPIFLEFLKEGQQGLRLLLSFGVLLGFASQDHCMRSQAEKEEF